ncbi:RNA dependent RNA polymerase-domain-containing protein [Phyllosticta citricarpa]
MSTSSSPQPRRVTTGRRDWAQWDEVKVKVMNLPARTSTLDVWTLFANEGEIIRIEVKPHGAHTKNAYVSFSPVPARPFWESECSIPGSNGGPSRLLRVDLLSPMKPKTLPSPGDPRRHYPEVMNVSARKLQFGFMYSESEMMSMKEVDVGRIGSGGGGGSSSSNHNINHHKNNREIRISINLKRREMNIRFWMTMWNEKRLQEVDQEFRFRLSLSQMDKIFEETPLPYGFGQKVTRKIWTIPLPLPPLCYRKVDADTTHKHDENVWHESQAWYRQTDVTNSHKELKTSPISLTKRDPVVDIGRWTVLRLDFDLVGSNAYKYGTMRRALIDWNIKFNEDKIACIPRQPCGFWHTLDTDRETSPTYNAYPPDLYKEPIHLEFPVRYQLEVCLSNGILNEYNITRDFLEHLAGMDSNRATTVLEKAAENSDKHFFDPMDIFNLQLGRKPAERTIPKHCAYSRSATITPSAIYLSTPTVEVSNRVIRDYARWQDRFLRVRFSDEKYEGKIHGTEGETENEIYSRIWRTLRNGINIGGRSYKFLAFGNSQFREHGAYFFAPLEHAADPEDIMTPSIIREEMGHFGDIREVARYAARMGQCFSTTRAVRDIDVQVTGEEDVVRNGFNFTDGVGRLSISVAKHIAEDFGLPFAAEDPPSLFQFRLGGCKGVLVIDPRLKDGEVRVRRSQRKFDSANEGLEVIRWSQFAPATLNRQLIIVLEALGIPGAAFIQKQNEQLSDLTKAMDDEDLAQDLLHKNIDFNMMTLTLAEMIANGFMRANDPFTMSVLRLWRSWNTKYLKEKAKIFIKDGAFLLGCVDETATLKGHFNNKKGAYPEIFVQISDPDQQGHDKVIEGKCIVARNPSLHPGDIRVVKAVNVPALRHLKNVLVFPQTGDRDLPNMCSGGDLDGDDYIVIWDKSLIPPSPCVPMDFTPPQKTFVDRVRLEDIARFFVEYIKNDSLGRIATNHLALADSEEIGVLSERCLTLAQLHSTAVDYPKSGIPARMSSDLKARRYPHFMTSKHRSADKTYHSGKILGQLFDQVQKVDFLPAFDAPFDARVLDAYAHSEDTLIRVADIKQSYDTAVHRIMAQHGIGTEFEVWSVFILDHNNSSRDYQMAEEFGRISGALKERFQNICIEEAGGRDFKSLAPFVAAMYVVTAKQIEHAVSLANQGTDPVEMPLMSFPWIFSHILGKIATGDAIVPDFTAQQPTGLRTKKKNPVVNMDDMTEEDKDLMRGERKQNQEILDLFGDVPSASQEPYKDTLIDVSTMPTEPVSYEDFVKSDEAKTSEDLAFLDVKEDKPEESKENTLSGRPRGTGDHTLNSGYPFSSKTNIDKHSATDASKNHEGDSKSSIGGSLPLRPKNSAETKTPVLRSVQDLTSPGEPLAIPDKGYLADVLGFEKSPALSDDVIRNRSTLGNSSPSSNRQVGGVQSLGPSTSSPGSRQPRIGRPTSFGGHNRANPPQMGATDTRDLQYLREVLSPTLSSSGFDSPTIPAKYGNSSGTLTAKPQQQLIDVLIPGGPNSKPKSMRLSSGTGSLPTGLPLGSRLDSLSVNFRAGPPDAPVIGIDPESVNPKKDLRPRWSETARPAASPGTIHEVLTETIDTVDASSPMTIVGSGFAAAENTTAPRGTPSSMLLLPPGLTSRSPSPHPDFSGFPGFTTLGLRATPPTQTDETVGRSSAATTSVASAAAAPPPPAVIERQPSQNVDTVPSTVHHNGTASAPAQSRDRADYIARLRAADKKKIGSSGKTMTAAAASTANTTSATQSQPFSLPTRLAPAPVPKSMGQSQSQIQAQTQTQTQVQLEEPIQNEAGDDDKEEGEIKREDDDEEEEEVTLEMKPNSTRSLLSKFE